VWSHVQVNEQYNQLEYAAAHLLKPRGAYDAEGFARWMLACSVSEDAVSSPESSDVIGIPYVSDRPTRPGKMQHLYDTQFQKLLRFALAPITHVFLGQKQTH
jgi:hypothetical protein